MIDDYEEQKQFVNVRTDPRFIILIFLLVYLVRIFFLILLILLGIGNVYFEKMVMIIWFWIIKSQNRVYLYVCFEHRVKSYW